ncbi:MAG: hypothetical protein DRG09_01880 [Epsilonproteobacteria bacterium]|nr:MAG: hypothetical protein DRG09_01880 [Campylobacterota bacterium]
MQEKNYTLNDILLSVFTIKENKMKKRLIHNYAIFGGLNSNWIKLVFFILPFAMYAAVFNPTAFKALGIAQAIVFYIILLVMAMQIVVGVTYFNNKKTIKKATKEWEKYFPNIDFRMILSSGVTPYVDFKKHYESALNDGLNEEAMKKRLVDDFRNMEEENIVLVEAMRKDKEKKEGK